MKLTGILFKPLKVLEEYKSEKGFLAPFKFLIFSTLISVGISFLFLLTIYISVIDVVISSFENLISTILLVLFLSAVFHLFAKIFRGKQPFYQTFKAFAYMSAFGIVESLISGIGIYIPSVGFARFLLGLWVLILWGSALKFYTELPNWKIGIIIFIMIMLSVILFFVLATIGASLMLGSVFLGSSFP